jgi:chromosome segregation ATPase
MHRSTATIVALLVCSGLGTSGPLGSSAFADEAGCERLQAALADRDREVAQHRDYSSQIFKQLEAARTELDTAQRANAQAQERANAAVLRARKEIAEAEVARQTERTTRDKELESARTQIAALKKETADLRAAAAERQARIEAKSREPVAAPQPQLAALQSNAKDSGTVAAEPQAKPSAVEPALQVAAQEDPQTEVFDPAKPMTLAKGTIRKWQQPDGSLFFGERPRPGSKLLGEVSRMGTAGGSHIN